MQCIVFLRRAKDNLQELVLFHYVGSKVIRRGGKHLYQRAIVPVFHLSFLLRSSPFTETRAPRFLMSLGFQHWDYR